MLLIIWRFLLGYVRFEIRGNFPERFLNLAYSSGINIWGQEPKDGRLVACMPLRNYLHIRHTAKKAKVRLKILGKFGLPFLIYRHRDRVGLFAGLAVLIVLISIMSRFIWVVNIETSPIADHNRLRLALENNGLSVGTYADGIDVLSLERKIMRDVPELSWAAVNIVGTTASLEIKSKEMRPDTSEINKPYNIKAKKDGLVVKLDVQNGSAMTSVGSGVTAGQLLVSGVCENPAGSQSLVHASARVIARTAFETKFKAPKQNVISVPTGEEFNRFKMDLLWLSSPKTPQLIPDSVYFQDENKYCAFLNGKYLPVGFTRETNYEYLPREFNFTEAQQKENAFKKLALYEAFYMPDITVEKRDITEKQDKDGLTLSVKYTCLEDIAVSEAIYTEESATDGEIQE